MKQSSGVEYVAFRSAQRSCARRGIAFGYRSFTEFLRDVGEKPPGEFLSGRSRYALFRIDGGRYAWREKSTNER